MQRYISPEMVMSKRFAVASPPRWRAAVLCFRDCIGSRELVRAFDAEPYDGKVLWGMEAANDPPFIYEAMIGGEAVGLVTRCLWGGPQAAILVEELAALGCRRLLGIGAAGAIDGGLSQGDQLYVARALPTDGTSRSYQAESLAPSPSLVETVNRAATLEGCALQPVCAATVDALYRETPDYIEQLRDQGAQIVSMETSPFYAAALACGVDAIWMGHVSDCLGREWTDWYIDMREKAQQIIITCRKTLELLFEPAPAKQEEG